MGRAIPSHCSDTGCQTRLTGGLWVSLAMPKASRTKNDSTERIPFSHIPLSDFILLTKEASQKIIIAVIAEMQTKKKIMLQFLCSPTNGVRNKKCFQKMDPGIKLIIKSKHRINSLFHLAWCPGQGVGTSVHCSHTSEVSRCRWHESVRSSAPCLSCRYLRSNGSLVFGASRQMCLFLIWWCW